MKQATKHLITTISGHFITDGQSVCKQLISLDQVHVLLLRFHLYKVQTCGTKISSLYLIIRTSSILLRISQRTQQVILPLHTSKYFFPLKIIFFVILPTILFYFFIFFRYCNFYTFANNLSTIAMFDYGFLSELMTRWALLLSQQLMPFLIDVNELFAAEILDWYLFGFRFGILFSMLADFKL